MRIGESVAFRLRRPREHDSGFRPAIVLSRNAHGYTLCVFLNPDLDMDCQSEGNVAGLFHARNTSPGEELNQFQDLDAIHGLDGEKPYEWQSQPLVGIHTSTKPMLNPPTPTVEELDISFDEAVKDLSKRPSPPYLPSADTDG